MADHSAVPSRRPRRGNVWDSPDRLSVAMTWEAACDRAAQSPRLAGTMISFRGELFLPVDEAPHEPRTEDVHGFHKILIAAVREQDSERAAGTMRAHIADTRRMVYQALEESDGAEVGTSRAAAQSSGEAQPSSRPVSEGETCELLRRSAYLTDRPCRT